MSNLDQPTKPVSVDGVLEGDNPDAAEPQIDDLPPANGDQHSDSAGANLEESNDAESHEHASNVRSPGELKRTSASISGAQTEPDPEEGPSQTKKSLIEDPSDSETVPRRRRHESDDTESPTTPKKPKKDSDVEEVDPKTFGSPDVDKKLSTPTKSQGSSPKPSTPILEGLLGSNTPPKTPLQIVSPAHSPSEEQIERIEQVPPSNVIQSPPSGHHEPIYAPTIKSLLAQPPMIPQGRVADASAPGLLSSACAQDSPLLRNLLSAKSQSGDRANTPGTGMQHGHQSMIIQFDDANSLDSCRSSELDSPTSVSTPGSKDEPEVQDDDSRTNSSETSDEVNATGISDEANSSTPPSNENSRVPQEKLMSIENNTETIENDGNTNEQESREESINTAEQVDAPIQVFGETCPNKDNRNELSSQTSKISVGNTKMKEETGKGSASVQSTCVSEHTGESDVLDGNSDMQVTEKESLLPTETQKSNVENDTPSALEIVTEERSASPTGNLEPVPIKDDSPVTEKCLVSQPADDPESKAESKDSLSSERNDSKVSQVPSEPEPKAESKDDPFVDEDNSKVSQESSDPEQKLKNMDNIKLAESSVTDSPGRKSRRLQNRVMSGDQPQSSSGSEDPAAVPQDDSRFKKPTGTPAKLPRSKKLESLGDPSVPESPSRRSARLQKVYKSESEQSDNVPSNDETKEGNSSRTGSKERTQEVGKVKKTDASKSVTRERASAKTKESDPPKTTRERVGKESETSKNTSKERTTAKVKEESSKSGSRGRTPAKSKSGEPSKSEHSAAKSKGIETKPTSQERVATKIKSEQSKGASRERLKESADAHPGRTRAGSRASREVSSNSEADRTDESGDENKPRAKRSSRRGSSK